MSVMEHPEEHKPVATPMPQLPSADFMSQDQWDIFYALMDGALPSITSQSAMMDKTRQISLPDDEYEKVLERAAKVMPAGTDRDALKAFLGHRMTEDPLLRKDCLRMLNGAPQKAQLAKVLELMNTRIGSLLFTGYWSPITQQPSHIRQAILQSWLKSPFETLRNLGKTFSVLAHKSVAMTSPLFHQLCGYTDTPKNWKAGEGYDFNFIQLESGNDVYSIDTDVVIVGSGCGGGVSAKNLAEAGHRVLVVDKGYYFPPSHLPMPQDAAVQYLFDKGGFYQTENGGASILAGGSWGGGGTVNWSVCLKPQEYVRKEWADSGLSMFTSPKFDECIDRVWDFVGANTSGLRHNHRNRVLLEGSRKLGFAVSEAPQNTAGKEHYCGQCHLGCGSAEKRGPAVSWLPAASQAGAQFMEGFQVDRIMFGEDGKTAVGVEGQWTARGPRGVLNTPESERMQRRVRIKAKKVIVSAGSLWSPLVLMASGVENRHLGQNLHIHPCNFVSATYEEDTEPWEGGIITSYSGEFENLDEKGHGVKLEPTCMVPYACLSMYPWTSGVESKLMLLKYRRLNSFISLTRDRDPGRVFPDPKTGEPRIDYTVSDFDRANTLEGVKALAKICYVTGATEIQPYLPGLKPFTKSASNQGEASSNNKDEVKDPEFADPAFAAWLKQVCKVDNKPPVGMWSSAHQMGTCRMSKSSEDGVVDERGRVWGREGLYVADASVFPSASGVNPMITLMSIADWVSRGVDEDLKG